MSASGEGDSINLNKEGETLDATLPEGISSSSSIDKDESCSQDTAKQNTPLTSTTKADNSLIDNIEESTEELEAVIEKKLSNNKEKALDIDSELDFELKWDDDPTDQNEDQTNIDDDDIEMKSKETASIEPTVKNDDEVKEHQGTLNDNLDPKIDTNVDTSSAQVSEIEANNAMDTDIVGEKTKSQTLNEDIENEPENLDIQINRSEDELLKSDELDEDDLLSESYAEDELLKTDGLDDVDNVSARVENDLLNPQMALDSESVDTSAKSDKEASTTVSETNSLDEKLVYSDAEVPDIEDKDDLLKTDRHDDVDNVSARVENELLNPQMALDSGIVDTSAKSSRETSTNVSETNSLDEQLVYSDVEVPDIEDKDLMDEIKAQITSLEKNVDTSEIMEKLQDVPEVLMNEKEYKTPEIAPPIEEKIEKDHGDISQVTEFEKINSQEEEESITIGKAMENDHGNAEQLEASSEIITSQKEKKSSPTNIINEKENEIFERDSVTEMDVDDDIPKSNQREKSDPSDTLASITDMETSSYEINKEHGLDKPDVMIEIPTQEFIEDFDDSDEPSNISEENIEKVNNQTNSNINKPDFINNIESKAQNQNLMKIQEIEDKIDVANTNTTDDHIIDKIQTDEKSATASTDNAAKDTVGIAQAENMDIDSNAASQIMEKPAEINSKDNTSAETMKPDDNITTVGNKVRHSGIILDGSSEQPKVLSVDVSPTREITLDKNKVVKESPVNSESLVDEVEKPKHIEESEPSTSKYHQELSDEDQETSDSLGLLAESSRVMEDDDEQEQEEQPEDDYDDDFDQDDESNQMTGEHSEDSNAQQSETDVPKEAMDVEESNDTPEPNSLIVTEVTGDIEESCDVSEVTGDIDVSCNDSDVGEVRKETQDVDELSAEKSDFQFQIGEVVGEKAEAAEKMDATDEAEKAVQALLQDQKEEESADAPKTVESIKTKQSDSSDVAEENSKLRQLLMKDSESFEKPEEKKSPSKTKKLEVSKPKHEINIVELEESSSEDDIQVVNKQVTEAPSSPKDVTSVKIPDEVEVMSTAAGDTSDMTQKPGETVISGIPKPVSHKPARLNTGEVTIKTAAVTAEPLVIPETTAPKTPEAKTPIDLGTEIFSLDSDDDEIVTRSKRKKKLAAVEKDKARESNKCINSNCVSDASVPLVPASVTAVIYYAANPQRGGGMCINCAKRLEERGEKLIKDVKELTPFLNMDMCMIREEFVEISDSDSDDEVAMMKKDDEIVGEKSAKFLEEHLADIFNDTWKKYDMEARLLTAETEINLEASQLEEECKKIDAMLDECQKETDKFRNELYDTFADERKELPAMTLFDTPISQWCGLEEIMSIPEVKESRQAKRRPPPAPEPPAKRAAIPLGYTPLDTNTIKPEPQQPEQKPAPPPAPTPPPAAPTAPPAPPIDVTSQNEDDSSTAFRPRSLLSGLSKNADISVVKLSVESAPAGLPAPGVATRPPLRPHMQVYAMRNSFGAWHKVTIVEVQPKVPGQFTLCRVKFEQPKNTLKVLPARCLAYEHPPDVRLTIGTRVIALFKDHRFAGDKKMEVEKKEAYYSGIVAEIPNPVNNYRYLIFFDDGYAQYVQHAVTRLVCECAPRVWDEVHPFSRSFVREYLRAYPERPMVRLHQGQSIKTEWNGKWWVSKVLQVDASLVHVHFEGKKESGIDKTEWIYRGSTRLAPLYLELQAAERQRSRPLPRAQAGRRFNMPYVEYTRSEEQTDKPLPAQTAEQTRVQLEQEIRRQRAVAKKSTAPAQPPAPPARDNVTSRVVFYTPKNAIKPYKMVSHTCGPKCKRTDVLALKDLRTYNPLTKPLLSGWERQQVRYRIPAIKSVMYRAPCGRRIRDYKELHQYLQAIDSDMGVDLFDFNPSTHCLAEFLLNKCLVSKKDLSHGKENVPVPCVNYYDESLPEFCSYNTERTPTAGVPLNLDPEFLCGCDCTDDCADKTKCACWKMTLEGARTIGLDTDEVGYVYKRLPEPLPSGIYECNVRCKCKQTCLNRVAQHPLQLKLQVFKTANRGWGIRALNDVPKGAFLCVYAGNLLTDATANLDGLNEGDEYLAELDYIEVVEQMKEGFEEDIPEDAKKLDQEEEGSTSSSSSSSSDEAPSQQDADDDFRPMLPAGAYTPSEYSKRLRKRDRSKKAKEKEDKEKKEKEQKDKDGNTEDCITISDDEELREPARFAARAGMGGKEFVSKYKSVRAHFGKDEACYIMDAKVQGNIGRYLNHSCTPNVFVQNVFVDTHDPRFPWVAFFALSQIRAGTELTWNYNYDVGSVPGKILYCYCNAPNCRGRLL